MSWSFGREVAVGSGGASAVSRTYTLASGASVPVGSLLVVQGGNLTNLLASPFIAASTANSGALSAWTVAQNAIDGGGLYTVFCCYAMVLGALTNTDTITLTFAGSSAPLLVARDFANSGGGIYAANTDRALTASAQAQASFSSGTTAVLTGADDLALGQINFDNGGTTSDIAPAAGWTATTTTRQGPIGSLYVGGRWQGLSSTAGVAFSGNFSPTTPAYDYIAGIVVVNAAAGTPPAEALVSKMVPMRIRR